jgi:RNA polymerase sigma-70 factor (ECF subfamily)
MPASESNVTQLLRDWSAGDKGAFDQLVPLVQAELRRLARRYVARERAGHTLQTSALVNEAYLRLVDQQSVAWKDRAHFLAVAAQVMRHVLVDYARRRGYAKRGGGAFKVSLSEAAPVAYERAAELLALDAALDALAAYDPRKSRVVELRFFGGLSVDETAEALGVAPVTVMREWRAAKAWLLDELGRPSE